MKDGRIIFVHVKVDVCVRVVFKSGVGKIVSIVGNAEIFF